MSELDDELRRRHGFVEETAQSVLDLLGGLSAEDAGVLGDRVEIFSRFASSVIMPNARDGCLTIPEEYKGKDVLPVVALKPGETVMLSPDFRQLSPLQRSNALATIECWQPTQASAIEELHAMEVQVQQVFGSKPVKEGIEKTSLGFASSLQAGFEYEHGELAMPPAQVAADKNLEVRMLGRPILGLLYSDEPLQPTLFHELDHVWNAVAEPLFVAPGDVRAKQDRILGRELPGFYRGALAARFLAQQGFELSRSGRNNIAVDDFRMEFASSPTDFDVRHDILRDYFAQLGYFDNL